MENYSDSDSDIEVLQELNDLNRHYSRPYVVRTRDNHWDQWDEIEFLRRFRVSKATAKFILNEIESEISHPTKRNKALPANYQLLLTLRFYATGCMQITVGDFSGIHQTTAGKTINRVTQAIASKRNVFIKLHLSPIEQQSNHSGFYGIARFPLVFGALDCTHVRIQSPGGNNSEHFRNRKGYFSINVQAMCSYNLKFLDVVARWPGASHDSTIFRNSSLCAVFESGQMGRNIILGDAGYPLNNYLLTPLQNPVTTAEKLYNESHIRTRNCIERCFGIWKRRFPVLSIGIRVNIELAQDIIVACAILHNICINNQDQIPTLEAHIDDLIDLSSYTIIANNENAANANNNRLRRQILINNYFSTLN